MDLNTFKAQLNARLSEINENEEGYTYYIASDAPELLPGDGRRQAAGLRERDHQRDLF